jgi:hypothetical protein
MKTLPLVGEVIATEGGIWRFNWQEPEAAPLPPPPNRIIPPS